MRKAKRSLALCLSLALALALSGCMADPSVETPTPGSTVPTAAPTPAPPAAFASRGMRIALFTSPNAVGDRSRNAAAYEGVLSFLVSRGGMDTVTPLQETSGDPASALRSVEQAAKDYDVVVCVGDSFTGLAGVADACPDKYFLLVDAVADAGAENLDAISYAEEQCGFYAGVAAALETKTDRIAVIGSLPTDANIRYYYGFRSGVAYTNGNFGTAAELVDLPEYGSADANGVWVGGNYTGSITDEAAGYSLAQALIGQNCDVLFTAAGPSGRGAYAAAKERGGVWIIGSDTDQFEEGVNGEGNVILTSVTKNIVWEVEGRLKSVADGSFQGGSHRLDAASGSVGYISSDDHQQMQPATLEVLAGVLPMMQDGTIVPGTGPQ